jgi:hypothetical protein
MYNVTKMISSSAREAWGLGKSNRPDAVDHALLHLPASPQMLDDARGNHRAGDLGCN